MMKKYRWSVAKSLEFLSSKKQDIDIFKSFLTQLNNFEVRLTKSNIIRSNDWLSDNSKEIEYEETIMKNTFELLKIIQIKWTTSLMSLNNLR